MTLPLPLCRCPTGILLVFSGTRAALSLWLHALLVPKLLFGNANFGRSSCFGNLMA